MKTIKILTLCSMVFLGAFSASSQTRLKPNKLAEKAIARIDELVSLSKKQKAVIKEIANNHFEKMEQMYSLTDNKNKGITLVKENFAFSNAVDSLLTPNQRNMLEEKKGAVRKDIEEKNKDNTTKK